MMHVRRSTPSMVKVGVNNSNIMGEDFTPEMVDPMSEEERVARLAEMGVHEHIEYLSPEEIMDRYGDSLSDKQRQEVYAFARKPINNT